MRPLAAAVLWIALPAAAAAGADADAPARGEYLARLGGCVACHSKEEGEALLTGGDGVRTPFGTFYPPNLTPDPETGLGGWEWEDFRRAMQEGRNPDGSPYFPVFPYTSYTRISEPDLRALWAYLRSLEPVSAPRRRHDTPWYLLRGSVWPWRWLYFEAGAYRPDPARTESWNRGAYIATALAHCAECHSPRTWLGGVVEQWRYAGAGEGPNGKPIPNITPDKETGIGRWTKDDLVYYLETGADPDGDYAGGLMAEVIDEGLAYLSTPDREALAEYIQSLPPKTHRMGR